MSLYQVRVGSGDTARIEYDGDDYNAAVRAYTAICDAQPLAPSGCAIGEQVIMFANGQIRFYWPGSIS